MDDDLKRLFTNHIDTITKLIEQSERRISECNKMTSKLVSVVESLSNSYQSNINNLVEHRNNLADQNSRLIVMLEHAQQRAEAMEKRNAELVDKMILSGKTSINVK